MRVVIALKAAAGSRISFPVHCHAPLIMRWSTTPSRPLIFAFRPHSTLYLDHPSTSHVNSSSPSIHHPAEITCAPGHHNISRNEPENALAKAATEITTGNTREFPISNAQLVRTGPEPREHFISTVVIRNRYRRLCLPPSPAHPLQCHTGHPFMSKYCNKHVPAEDRSCSCGEPIQMIARPHPSHLPNI